MLYGIRCLFILTFYARPSSTFAHSIDLRDNELSGTIPTELVQLTSLTNLFLNRNKDLTGPIPSQLGQLTALKLLYLNNNSLTGSIPSELARLISLKRLKLQKNDLIGPIPDGVCDLTSLVFADCDICQPGCCHSCVNRN